MTDATSRGRTRSATASIVALHPRRTPHPEGVHSDELLSAFSRLIDQFQSVNTLVLRSNLDEKTKAAIGIDIMRSSVAAFSANNILVAFLLDRVARK